MSVLNSLLQTSSNRSGEKQKIAATIIFLTRLLELDNPDDRLTRTREVIMVRESSRLHWRQDAAVHFPQCNCYSARKPVFRIINNSSTLFSDLSIIAVVLISELINACNMERKSQSNWMSALTLFQRTYSLVTFYPQIWTKGNICGISVRVVKV